MFLHYITFTILQLRIAFCQKYAFRCCINFMSPHGLRLGTLRLWYAGKVISKYPDISAIERLKLFYNIRFVKRCAAVFVVCKRFCQVPFTWYRIVVYVIQFLIKESVLTGLASGMKAVCYCTASGSPPRNPEGTELSKPLLNPPRRGGLLMHYY